jgi:hypothetical protein
VSAGPSLPGWPELESRRPPVLPEEVPEEIALELPQVMRQDKLPDDLVREAEGPAVPRLTGVLDEPCRQICCLPDQDDLV